MGYVEAHGTGTVVGDPVECQALDAVFCRDRAQPLLIGSVKSNMGHAEAGAGACSLVKVLLTFENGAIPPNIHFERARPTIPALVERRLLVCVDRTPFDGDHIAVSAFGFGGANSHALFARNAKAKVNGGLPADDLPRLVTWSGRTQAAVDTVLDALQSQPLDAEYVGLLHSAQSAETPGYVHRGYTVLGKAGSAKAVCLARASGRLGDRKPPVVWLFAGIGSQWAGMGRALMTLPRFRASIGQCHAALKAHDPTVDLERVIVSDDAGALASVVHTYVGIAAIQIGLVDLLRALDVPMDYCVGHSVGELG